jgi:hypothetical protein
MKRGVKRKNLNMIAVFAILTILIVAIALGIWAFTGRTVGVIESSVTNCIDTDGGHNINDKGTITYINSTGSTVIKTDFCTSGTQLYEYFCT